LDNVNAYVMQEDGRYVKKSANGDPIFNIHHEFYNITREIIEEAKLF
jgi:polyphosphate kinase